MPKALETLSATDLATLPRDKTFFIFSTSALESADPNTPLNTGIELAHALALRIANRIETDMPGWQVVVGPKLPFGTQPQYKKTAVAVRGFLVRDAMVDLCRPLHKMGFKYFGCTTHLMSPRQLTALEESGKILGRRFGLPFNLGLKSRPVFLSLNSALVPPADVWRSPFGISRTEPLPLDKMESAIFERLRLVLEGVPPRSLFRTWYSVLFPNQSFFMAWVFAIGTLLLFWLWILLI